MQELTLPITLTALVIYTLYTVLFWAPRRTALRAERHIFLDLETYSTRPNAAILAIGAVCVNGLGLELGRIKILVDVSDARKNGHVDLDTVDWWEMQSDEAKRLTFDDGDRFSLAMSLSKFSHWFKLQGAVDGVWGGCIILRSAYTTVSGEVPAGCPWDYWQERDVRTIVALKYQLGARIKSGTPFEGVPHNCVDDAAHQAKYTIAIMRAL